MTNFCAVLLALAIHESGGSDIAVGKAGEVSRFQIMPAVWKAHTHSKAWTNPDVSREVATKILRERCNTFARINDRLPSPREIYALWNAPGLFALKGYLVDALPQAIRERCDRFAKTLRKVEAAQPKPGK